jgi:hypothetical protein
MPVPTIPSAISLGNIQTEFGGSNPIAISEYYNNASPDLIPSGTANATGVVIPNSGNPIRFSNFSGALKTEITGGTYTGGGGGYGYSTYQVGATASFGTLTGSSTVRLSSTNTGTLSALYSSNGGTGPMGVPLQTFTLLSVDGGDFTAVTWTSITVGATTVARTSAYSITYDSGNNRTTWIWDFDSGQSPTGISPFAPADGVTENVIITA